MKFDLTAISEELSKLLEDPTSVNDKREIVLQGSPANAFLTLRQSNASGHFYADIFYAAHDEGIRADATDTWRLDELPLQPTSEQIAKAVYDHALSSFPDV